MDIIDKNKDFTYEFKYSKIQKKINIITCKKLFD